MWVTSEYEKDVRRYHSSQAVTLNQFRFYSSGFCNAEDGPIERFPSSFSQPAFQAMTQSSDGIDETIKKTQVIRQIITFRPRNAWLPLAMKRRLLS